MKENGHRISKDDKDKKIKSNAFCEHVGMALLKY